MYNAEDLSQVLSKNTFTGKALVMAVSEDKGFATVSLATGVKTPVCRAQVALATSSVLAAGDEVLVTGEPSLALYIIGTLGKKDGEKWLHAKSGAAVCLEETGEASVFRVYSGSGELVIEYDGTHNRSKIFTADKGLMVEAPTGDISLTGNTIALTAQSKIELTTSGCDGDKGSQLSLGRMLLGIKSPEISCTARRASFCFDRLYYVGRMLVNNIKDVRSAVKRCELSAGTLLTKAKNLFCSVEEVQQQKAGRLRLLIDSTCHIKSKKMVMKADEDVKINAEKIHLG